MGGPTDGLMAHAKSVVSSGNVIFWACSEFWCVFTVADSFTAVQTFQNGGLARNSAGWFIGVEILSSLSSVCLNT